MNIHIKYFGMLSEITQCDEEMVSFSGGQASELLMMLFKKYPVLKQTDFQVAQNYEIITRETFINSNNLALLPPFSGG